jgi:hypothetical protein
MAADSFDLAIHAGDVACGTADGVGGGSYAQYDSWVFGVYATWLRSRAIFPAVGNHDDEVDFGRAYRDVFVLPENGGSGDYPDRARTMDRASMSGRPSRRCSSDTACNSLSPPTSTTTSDPSRRVAPAM